MTSVLFWDFTQRRMVVSYGRFGATSRPHLHLHLMLRLRMTIWIHGKVLITHRDNFGFAFPFLFLSFTAGDCARGSIRKQ